jgi:integrase
MIGPHDTVHDANCVGLRSVTRSQGATARRPRGSIDELPSGALRVRVYAGVDPVSKRRHDLIEIIAPDPGPTDGRVPLATGCSARLRNGGTRDQGHGGSAPGALPRPVRRCCCHVDALPGLRPQPPLAVLRQDQDGRAGRGHSRCVLRGVASMPGPLLWALLTFSTAPPPRIVVITALPSTAAGRWVQQPSGTCTSSCRAPTSARCGGSGSSVNPLTQAQPPAAPVPNPHPPSASEAAQIVNEAWKDPDGGALIWLVMTTGAR